MWFYDILEKIAQGGPVMIPIALVSVWAWAWIVARWIGLRREGDPMKLLEDLEPALEGRDAAKAAAICAQRRSMAARAAGRVIEHLERASGKVRASVVREAALREFPAVDRGLATVAVLAGVAPLLGLLGTVTGMIGTFEAITIHGTGNARPLAEGISEALLTTQAGLIVALPTLLACNVLHRRAERVRRGAQDVLNKVMLSLSGRRGTSAGPGRDR